MNIVNIAFCFDRNLWMQVGVCLASLLYHKGENTFYNIFCVVSDDVNDFNKNQLRNILNSFDVPSNIKFINMPSDFDDAYTSGAINKMAYARLLLPLLLSDIDKVVYMDVDILIKNDLLELFSMDIGDNLVAGVKDIINNDKIFNKLLSSGTWKSFDFNKLRGKYINSGVLLMNLALMRKLDICNKFISLSKYQFPYHDQDIINFVCKSSIFYLPLKYNVMPDIIKGDSRYGCYFDLVKKGFVIESDFKEAILNPYILHYTLSKPWKYSDKPMCEEWWLFSKYTPFEQVFHLNFISNKDRELHLKISKIGLLNAIKRFCFRKKIDIAGGKTFWILGGIIKFRIPPKHI